MTGFPDVAAADHHILVGGRPAFTYFSAGRVLVGYDGTPPEGARAVGFAGSGLLVGVVPVSLVLSATPIERVLILGGLTAVPEMLIDTLDFVRPVWRDGVLTLLTQFGRGGVLTPFESPTQTPCGCH